MPAVVEKPIIAVAEDADFPETTDVKRRTVGFMSLDAYFAFEEAAAVRHEYWNGKVVTMAGGTPPHNKIVLNIASAMLVALSSSGLAYEIYSPDQQVATAAKKRFYPDVTVADDPPRYDAKNSLLNPLIIVEVLSESTRTFDLNGKFAQYRTIQSLRHYLTAEQDQVSVTHHENINGQWTKQGTFTDLADVLLLALGASQIAVPVQKIYARIVFDAA